MATQCVRVTTYVSTTAEADGAYAPANVVSEVAQEALQRALDLAGAAGGGMVLVPPNTTIELTSQVSISSGVTLYLSEGALLERSWSSTNTDKQVSATIINANAPTWATFLASDPYTPGTLDTGIRILGPGKIGVSSALRATVDGDTNQRTPVIYMVGVDDFVLDDVTLDTGGRDWTVTIYGDRARIGDNVKIVGGEYVFEDGIHVMGGTGGRIGRCHVESGDDAIAFGSNYDNPISDWTVDHPYVVSQRGNALSFIRAREGDTSGSGAFTTDVEHVRVRGLSGRSGLLRNGVMVVKEDAASAGTIHDIDVELDVEMGESATHDGTNDQALHILGGSGRIRAHVRNPLVQALYVDRAATWDIDLTTDAGPQSSTDRAVQVVGATDLTLNGRIVAPSATYAVQIASCPLTHFGTLTIVDAPSGIAAVRMMTAGNVLTASRLRIDKASGASDARGVEFAAAASVELFEFRADVNRPFSNAGTAASIQVQSLLPERERTIASGALSVQGEGVLHLLGEGGSSDSLATITNGYPGQILEVRNGEASPGTVTVSVASTGNIAVGATRTLDTAAKGLLLRWNGVEWVELQDFS